MKLSRLFFFLLVLLIPLNLGRHFIIPDAFVWGTLVDYLIPTIYVQDILAVLILLLWFLENGLPKKYSAREFFKERAWQVLVLFIAAVGFSTLSSLRIFPASYVFLRLLLYVSLSIYVSYEVKVEKDFPVILNLLSIDLVFLGLLAIVQFGKQGAVFNNYLFFGEQPYSLSTWGVDRENVFGNLMVPAYGLFRHPNIFGGFLSIVLIWLIPYLPRKRIYLLPFAFGFISLLLTFSYVAWGAFLFGLAAYSFLYYFPKIETTVKKRTVVIVSVLFCLTFSLIPLFFLQNSQASFFRRGNLLISALRIFKEHPLFGVGPGNITLLIDQYAPNLSRDFRFTQPVHNIFVLILTENGVFAYLLFLSFLVFVFRKLINPGYFSLFLISICQILLLGSLDHYLWTIQQTSLLLWILLGLVLKKEY